MSFTVTFHLWWLLAYLGVGVGLFLPLAWWGNRKIYPREPFPSRLWRQTKRAPWGPLVVIALWPVAIWEELT